MPHYGTLQNYEFDNFQDVRGSGVYGVNNERLGKVDDVIFDHSTGEIRYVVVGTGGWLDNKKFLVPINRIQPYGNQEDKFYAELDKKRIQMLPEFDPQDLQSEAGWSDYEKRYQERWKDKDQSKKPEAKIPEQPELAEPGVYVLDRVPEEEHKPDVKQSLDPGYDRRWIDFQQKLREGRDKVVRDCPFCGTQDKVA